MCRGDWARRASVPLGRINPAGAHFVRAVGVQCLGNSHAALLFTPFPTETSYWKCNLIIKRDLLVTGGKGMGERLTEVHSYSEE